MRVRVERYPDGSASGVAYVPRGSSSGDGSSWWSALDRKERQEQNRYRVGRRAGQQVRRYIRHGNLRRLLTFTNGGAGEGWPNLREALRTFAAWYRADGRALLGDTGVVVVPERGGQGGRVHLHAAIRSGYRLDYSAIIRSWSAHLEAHGYHSAIGSHRFHAGDDRGKHSRGFTSARICAGYLAKYLAKGFSEEYVPQERRYRAEEVRVPEPQTLAGFTLEDVSEALCDTFGPGVVVVPYADHEGKLGGFWFDSA